ncbi:MAG: PatB family C-S lyase [Candidatus Cloacimonetes bacterium]|nr:PatB family C-S lyase [Candidatus Cloacimonadota bacterium]
MKYDFDNSPGRGGTNCYKWDFLFQKFGDEDLLPLWVADMDLVTARPIVTALCQRAQHGIYGYSFRPDSYYQAIKGWYERRHAWEISTDWIVDSPGVVPAINFALQAYTSPGDRILVQTPVYDPFFEAVVSNNRILLKSSLILENNHYRIDFDDMKQKLSQDVKVLIFCSPHNPVGRVWRKSELLHLLALCVEHQVLVLSDEIHSDIIFPEFRHIPLASLAGSYQKNIITFNAPSKTFNVAGLMNSYVLIPDSDLREGFRNILVQNHLLEGNIFGMIALEAAYTSGEEWLNQLIGYLESNYAFLCDFIETEIPFLRVIEMEGTYLAWLDFRALGFSDTELAEIIVKKARIALTRGSQYGKEGEGFMRLNFACPRYFLETVLLRLKKVLQEISNQ